MGLTCVQVLRSFSSVLCIHQWTLDPPGGHLTLLVALFCYTAFLCQLVCFYAKFQASVFSYEAVVMNCELYGPSGLYRHGPSSD